METCSADHINLSFYFHGQPACTCLVLIVQDEPVYGMVSSQVSYLSAWFFLSSSPRSPGSAHCCNHSPLTVSFETEPYEIEMTLYSMSLYKASWRNGRSHVLQMTGYGNSLTSFPSQYRQRTLAWHDMMMHTKTRRSTVFLCKGALTPKMIIWLLLGFQYRGVLSLVTLD